MPDTKSTHKRALVLLFIVWFQKISIPLPRREFHLGPPLLPGFPFFEVSYNPFHPAPDFPQFVKHPPTPLENFVQEGRVLKMKQLIQI